MISDQGRSDKSAAIPGGDPCRFCPYFPRHLRTDSITVNLELEFVWGYDMPFLDPTAQFDPEVKQYRPALEKFSKLLEQGELDEFPVPRGVLGPIRFVQVSRASRDDDTEVVGSVRDHVINLLAGDPYREPELKYNFNMLLLLDVFRLPIEVCGQLEEVLDEKVWAPDLDLGLE